MAYNATARNPACGLTGSLVPPKGRFCKGKMDLRAIAPPAIQKHANRASALGKGWRSKNYPMHPKLPFKFLRSGSKNCQRAGLSPAPTDDRLTARSQFNPKHPERATPVSSSGLTRGFKVPTQPSQSSTLDRRPEALGGRRVSIKVGMLFPKIGKLTAGDDFPCYRRRLRIQHRRHARHVLHRRAEIAR